MKQASQTDLIAATKFNLFDLFRFWGRSSKVALHETENLAWIDSDLPWELINGVFKSRLPAARVEGAIERTISSFEARGVPRSIWWIVPDMQPLDLGQRLENRGFVFQSGSPGMALELCKLHEPSGIPKGFRVEVVENHETLSGWCDVVARCFADFFKGDEAVFARWLYDLQSELGFSAPLRSYVGLLEDRVVATSQVFLVGNVAGIYWVSTLPEARGRGIGAAVTAAPLIDARARGHQFAILHASSKGYPVYRRLGFHEVCKMDVYMWARGRDG